MIDMEIYIELLKLLENYFQVKDWKNIVQFSYQTGLYDVRGRVSSYEFYTATEREISFMKKNYILKFDINMPEKYLVNNATSCTKYR